MRAYAEVYLDDVVENQGNFMLMINGILIFQV